jgi:hypothetical protein
LPVMLVLDWVWGLTIRPLSCDWMSSLRPCKSAICPETADRSFWNVERYDESDVRSSVLLSTECDSSRYSFRNRRTVKYQIKWLSPHLRRLSHIPLVRGLPPPLWTVVKVQRLVFGGRDGAHDIWARTAPAPRRHLMCHETFNGR